MSAKGKFIAIAVVIAVILAAAVIYSDIKQKQKEEYYRQLETVEETKSKEDKEPSVYEMKEAVKEKLSGRAFGAETDAGYIVYSFGPYGVEMNGYQDSSDEALLIVSDEGRYSLSDDMSQITMRFIKGGNHTYDFEILKKSIRLSGYKFKETDRVGED